MAIPRLPPVAGLHRIGPRSWAAEKPMVDVTIKRHFRKGANPKSVKASFARRVCEKYRETEIIYTDGSKKDELVGIGIHSKDYNEFHRLGSLCSVFSAEAAAISRAIAHPRSAPLLIVSDSASVLDALQSPSNKHPFVQEIQELLNE
ncbi:hypothetical protein RP20_CCG004235 [Aedes albopictus]|nr:hypothetical protein RP20_CCG004235 [Aedes albopictus]